MGVIRALRSLLFYLGFLPFVVVMCTLSCLLFFLPIRARHHFITSGVVPVMWWLRICCGIRIQVSGLENIPSQPCVVLSNHQSTWETFYLQRLFSPAAVILKRELLFLPFFGWALYLLHPIAIVRSNPAGAIRQVLRTGKQRLQEGFNVIIYPEGTRARGQAIGEFKTSGAAVARSAGAPILPVRHNAGDCWPVGRFMKHPGTIYLHIGPAIESSDRDPREITEQARNWVLNAHQ